MFDVSVGTPVLGARGERLWNTKQRKCRKKGRPRPETSCRLGLRKKGRGVAGEDQSGWIGKHLETQRVEPVRPLIIVICVLRHTPPGGHPESSAGLGLDAPINMIRGLARRTLAGGDRMASSLDPTCPADKEDGGHDGDSGLLELVRSYSA